MAQSSAPKPPKIADRVRLEAAVNIPLVATVVTLAWNFLVAPNTGLPTVNLFAALGGVVVLSSLAVVAGYATGLGIVRRSLAEQEEYGRAAAAYLEALEAELDDADVDLVGEPRARKGGQG